MATEDNLRERAKEIRGAFLPESVTNEAVGGLLLDIINFILSYGGSGGEGSKPDARYWNKEELTVLDQYLYVLGDKIKALYADNAGDSELFEGHSWKDYFDQPLRTFDPVKFKSVAHTDDVWHITENGDAKLRDILGRIITISGGLMTDDFIAGMTGAGTGIVNKSEVHTDRGVFRKYIEVLALVVSKMYWRGGRQCLSPAGMKVSKVEEYDDYWRLYMETEDGQTNEFTIGAQARCNNYGNGTQKYYWRLVVGIGADYVDLSKTDCDTNSGTPSVGDDVVQFGHRTDPYLQWVVMDSSFSDDAGRTIYAGVNSYDLSGKMVLRIGVSPTDPTRIGLFTRHGEFSDVIDGINQDIEDNQQAIQDTKDAADAIQTILDNLTGIIIPDMQNQLDGAIQSWDGEVEPTLNNYPANEWTTDAERAKHVGDTYIYYTTDTEGNTVSSRYNFRFVDGVYKWELIADSVSAELEVKLRELTGTVGKKNSITYSNNVPTPAYNIDDLWIKEDGSMYICRAQKMDGMQGSAADWELFNDTMLRLAKMADDGIISKEEKATLRDTWNQIQKEFVSYQAQATKYGVSITALQNAYNTLNTFLTNTVKLSQNVDTSLTVAQKTEYNQDFANYYSERTAFANIIAQKVADESIGNLQIGMVNMLKGSNVELNAQAYRLGNYYFDKKLEVGKEYTFVICYTLGANSTSIDVYQDSGYTTLGVFRKQGNKVIESRTFKYSSTRTDVYIGLYQTPDGTYGSKVHWAVLVEGNKGPNSWIPSQADNDANAQAIAKAEAELAETKANAYADGIVTEAEQNAINEAEAKAIASNINMLNAEKADIDAYYTKLYANAYLTGTAKTNLASAKTAYNTAHANLISSINTAIADGKATATEKADVDAKFSAYNNALSAYQTRVGEADKAIQDQIKALAEQDATNKVDGIQIGGTNLFPISRLNTVGYRGSSSKEGSGPEIIFKCNNPSTWAILPVSIPTPVVPANTDFIISMDIRNTNGFGFEVTATSSTATIFGKINFENTTSTWKRISQKYNSGSANNIGGINLWGVGDVRHIKIEIGNKATDWSPSPEDVDQAIQDAIAKTVDITSPSQVFKYGPGYTGTPTPSSIVLTATPRNFTPTSYQWQYLNGSTWTNISGATSSTYSIAPGNTTLFPSGTNVRTFRCICNGDEKLSDSFTIAKLADGATGADGKGVSSTVTTYQASTSGTTAPTGTWSPTIPAVAAGSYLWSKTEITYTDDQKTTMYSVARMGTNGTNGTNGNAGNGVSSTVITYQASTSGTTAPTGTWSSSIPSVPAGQYLWTRTVINYTSGSPSTIYSVGMIGKTGADGKDAYTILLGNESHAFAGSTAAALAGSTPCSVMAYKGATQVAATLGTISGLPTGMTASVASNGTMAPVITFTVTTSMNTASGTVNIPVTVDGKTFTKVFSYSIAFKGATGQTGATGKPGEDGRGVKSVVEQYYLSTSSTTQTGGSWSSTMPAWTTGKYLWTRLITTYTDNSTTTSTPILDPLNEAVDKAEQLSKDDIAKQLGFTDFEALKKNALTKGPLLNAGLVNADIIDVNKLISNQAWVDSLWAKIITTKVVKAEMLSVGGFTFKDNYIIGGSETAGGIKITSTSADKSFKAYKDASHYVEMFYRSASDWGLKGVDESAIFQLGSTNKIGPFTILATTLNAENTYVSGSATYKGGLELSKNMMRFSYASGSIYQQTAYIGVKGGAGSSYGTDTILVVEGGDIWNQGTVRKSDGTTRSCIFYTSDIKMRGSMECTSTSEILCSGFFQFGKKINVTITSNDQVVNVGFNNVVIANATSYYRRIKFNVSWSDVGFPIIVFVPNGKNQIGFEDGNVVEPGRCRYGYCYQGMVYWH